MTPEKADILMCDASKFWTCCYRNTRGFNKVTQYPILLFLRQKKVTRWWDWTAVFFHIDFRRALEASLSDSLLSLETRVKRLAAPFLSLF